jgi:hypothetical protein
MFLLFVTIKDLLNVFCWILLQGFEKMISGMYLGDIVRRVILRMSQDSDIFGPVSSRLSIPFILQYVTYLHRNLGWTRSWFYCCINVSSLLIFYAYCHLKLWFSLISYSFSSIVNQNTFAGCNAWGRLSWTERSR